MRKLTPTLTQSGLLAVLLQRQRYKTSQLAWRRCTTQAHARRPLEYLTWPWRALTAPVPVRHSRRALVDTSPPILNLFPSRLPCLIQSTRTPNSSNRFTTICGSNIPNESSKMANPHAIRKVSHDAPYEEIMEYVLKLV